MWEGRKSLIKGAKKAASLADGAVRQSVQCLQREYEDLSSDPSTHVGQPQDMSRGHRSSCSLLFSHRPKPITHKNCTFPLV